MVLSTMREAAHQAREDMKFNKRVLMWKKEDRPRVGKNRGQRVSEGSAASSSQVGNYVAALQEVDPEGIELTSSEEDACC